MLVLFVTEADEEITAMRQALRGLEQEISADLTNSRTLEILQNSTRKLKGIAGSIGYEHISAIARCAEKLVGQMQAGTTSHQTGLIALTHAVQALETTLLSIASRGREDDDPHTQLELIYDALGIKL